MESNINNGVLKEIPQIQIDLFVQNNTKSINWETVRFFFLTHAHTDHVQGIIGYPRDSALFLPTLKEKAIKYPNLYKFYMHEYTFHYLEFYLKKYQPLVGTSLADLKVLKDNGVIVFLEANIWYEIGSVEHAISVMPLSAGHCTGSLMFYFKSTPQFGEATRILYTGDCRIHDEDMKEIYSNIGTGEKLDVLYIDTTFYSERNTVEFPSRKSVIAEMLKCVNDPTKEKYILVMAGFLTQINVALFLKEIFNEKIITLCEHQHTFCENIKMLKGMSAFKDGPTDCGIYISQDNKEQQRDPNTRYTVFKAFPNDNFPGIYSTHLSRNEIHRLVYHFKPTKVIPLCKRRYDDETEMTNALQAFIFDEPPEEPEDLKNELRSYFHDFTRSFQFSDTHLN